MRLVLGEISITPKASELIPPTEIQAAIQKHSQRDWTNVNEKEDLRSEEAVKCNGHFVSRYVASNGHEFVVFTLIESPFTGVLLRREYSNPSGGLEWVH